MKRIFTLFVLLFALVEPVVAGPTNNPTPGTNSAVGPWHTNGWVSPNFKTSLIITNQNISFAIQCLVITNPAGGIFAPFCPLLPAGQCPDPEFSPCYNTGGGPWYENTNGDILALLGSGCTTAGVRGITNNGHGTGSYTYVYDLKDSNSPAAVVISGGSWIRGNSFHSAHYMLTNASITKPDGNVWYGTGDYAADLVTNTGNRYELKSSGVLQGVLWRGSTCLAGTFHMVTNGAGALATAPDITFNAAPPPAGFIPNLSTNASESWSNNCCGQGFFVLKNNNDGTYTPILGSLFPPQDNPPLPPQLPAPPAYASRFPTNGTVCFSRLPFEDCNGDETDCEVNLVNLPSCSTSDPRIVRCITFSAGPCIVVYGGGGMEGITTH